MIDLYPLAQGVKPYNFIMKTNQILLKNTGL